VANRIAALPHGRRFHSLNVAQVRRGWGGAEEFRCVCVAYLDDDEFADLQVLMMENPEAGDVVPRTGGVHKLRWRHGTAAN
jgi:hypothetical protein